MARPKKDINWDVVEKKVEAGCTAKEIYECVCNEDTFYDRFKEHYGESFSDYSGRFRNVGHGNVRYIQYIKALSGNTNMLQLLGREWLAQGQDPEMMSPFEDLIAMRHEIMMLKSKNQKLQESLNANKPQTGQEL